MYILKKKKYDEHSLFLLSFSSHTLFKLFITKNRKQQKITNSFECFDFMGVLFS